MDDLPPAVVRVGAEFINNNLVGGLEQTSLDHGTDCYITRNIIRTRVGYL